MTTTTTQSVRPTTVPDGIRQTERFCRRLSLGILILPVTTIAIADVAGKLLTTAWGVASGITSLCAIALVIASLVSPVRSESDSDRTLRHIEMAKWVFTGSNGEEIPPHQLCSPPSGGARDFTVVIYWRTIRPTLAIAALVVTMLGAVMLVPTDIL